MEKFKRKAEIEVVSGRVEGGGGAGRRTSKKINKKNNSQGALARPRGGFEIFGKSSKIERPYI